MKTRRIESEEDTYFTSEQVMSMSLKKYNNLLTSGRGSTKYPKYAQILYLEVLPQKLADESNNSSEKYNTYNRDTTKGEPAYIRGLPPWMLEEPKVGMGNKNIMENNTGGASNTVLKNSSGSATIHKTTGNGLETHQAVLGALSHQARDTATRS